MKKRKIVFCLLLIKLIYCLNMKDGVFVDINNGKDENNGNKVLKIQI